MLTKIGAAILPLLGLVKTTKWVARADHIIPSPSPPIGSVTRAKFDKGVGVGIALVAAGLVLNEWVVGSIASPDGRIELTWARAVIWSGEALLLLLGYFIIKHPHYGKGTVLLVLPFLSLGVWSFLLYAALELFRPSLRICRSPTRNTIRRKRDISSMMNSCIDTGPH